MEDRSRARHRISKFLLRHNRHPETRLRAWHASEVVGHSHVDGSARADSVPGVSVLDEIEGRLKRLDAAIHLEATESQRAPVIQALQTLRGVAEVIATSLVAEIGEFSRFKNSKKLMACAGLVPMVYSSGSSRWQGRITKAGNSHLRRVLGEAAWSYRYKPVVKGTIRKRKEGQSTNTGNSLASAGQALSEAYENGIPRHTTM